MIFFLLNKDIPDGRNALNHTDNTPCQKLATKIRAFQSAFEVRDLAANGTCWQLGYLTDLNWCTHVLQNKRFVSESYSNQSNCFNHCGWTTREFDAEPEPELVLHFFWAGWSNETVFSDPDSALRFWDMPKTRSELCDRTEIIPVERLTVIIKIIHFLMQLRPKQSIEMPKQSIEICKLINLLIKQSS